jgi:AraC-like DNA-binding protein
LAQPLPIDDICRLIDALMARGYPNIDAVARMLRLSTRTFQRLLHEQGLKYTELVDRCRCGAACEALTHTQTSVHAIATALGYRDTSSFSRAFRRWTGMAPRAFRSRAQHLPNDGLTQVNPSDRNG